MTVNMYADEPEGWEEHNVDGSCRFCRPGPFDDFRDPNGFSGSGEVYGADEFADGFYNPGGVYGSGGLYDAGGLYDSGGLYDEADDDDPDGFYGSGGFPGWGRDSGGDADGAWALGPLDDDDLQIDFAFDHAERRLLCVNTVGLWRLGIPELFIRPPRGYGSGKAMEDARLAVFLGSALIRLGFMLLAAEGFEIPPYRADLDGRPVRFWLGGHEPPFKQLALILGPEVDTVIRVECSLWPTPPRGDG